MWFFGRPCHVIPYRVHRSLFGSFSPGWRFGGISSMPRSILLVRWLCGIVRWSGCLHATLGRFASFCCWCAFVVFLFLSFLFCLFYLYYVTSSLSCAVCVAASAQDPPFLGFPSHFSLSHAEIAHCVLTPSGGFPLVVLVPVALGSALTTR